MTFYLNKVEFPSLKDTLRYVKLILVKKILECRSIFTRFHLPFGRVRFFFRTKFIPFLLLPKDALRQGEIGGSRGEDFQKPSMYVRFSLGHIKIRFTEECYCLVWLTLVWLL